MCNEKTYFSCVAFANCLWHIYAYAYSDTHRCHFVANHNTLSKPNLHIYSLAPQSNATPKPYLYLYTY